jgi:hypothetical protein
LKAVATKFHCQAGRALAGISQRICRFTACRSVYQAMRLLPVVAAPARAVYTRLPRAAADAKTVVLHVPRSTTNRAIRHAGRFGKRRNATTTQRERLGRCPTTATTLVALANRADIFRSHPVTYICSRHARRMHYISIGRQYHVR